ncbi:hypothetical protein DW322_05220 [Rhodococcus rhodnii]|uniref:Uncharacterized protein n=2 Tax=Rhodococcus rhodnii TaxID=38312 RepID=R7WRC2_9NOCA|nr:hypothetical protein [Rhodococcus rhodnii]EOM77846.1 hypothetical protein Rrhod_0784 [Rhodococcus rhodnii LMG 5362]TXG89724.1 hypothetical protein DW322_05220 [Rhodococcus rhodnii]
MSDRRHPVPISTHGLDIDAILGDAPTHISGYSIEFGGASTIIKLNKQSVDDDGTFVPAQGNAVLRFWVRSGSQEASVAIEALRHAAPIGEGPIYSYAHPATPSTVVAAAVFFSQSRDQIEAPGDFDWHAYSPRHEFYSVVRTGPDDPRPIVVYRSLNRPFYLPFMDRRGAYWPVRATPPPVGSGLRDSFDAVLGGVSRKAAIRNNIRPLTLEWVGGKTVTLTFQLIRNGCCYRLDFEFPTDDDMMAGRFLLPGGIVQIRDPSQFAAGLVSMLAERSSFSESLLGTECK